MNHACDKASIAGRFFPLLSEAFSFNDFMCSLPATSRLFETRLKLLERRLLPVVTIERPRDVSMTLHQAVITSMRQDKG